MRSADRVQQAVFFVFGALFLVGALVLYVNELPQMATPAR
jgi:hypothetical protein